MLFVHLLIEKLGVDMVKHLLKIIFISAFILSGCNLAARPGGTPIKQGSLPVEPPSALETQAAEEGAIGETPAPTPTVLPPTPKPSATPQPTPTAPLPTRPVASNPPAASQPQPTATVPPVFGPDGFPADINPLTGLPVQKKENLLLPPALVSVTNFPTTARPQAGLSFSPFVFELYIGEGMSRFLALFYGDMPVTTKTTPGKDLLASDPASIGPIRSGRLPYETIRSLYSGFLVMASGADQVRSSLSSFTNVFGSDSSDINSAMIQVTQLEKIAQNTTPHLKTPLVSGLMFDRTAPAGGKAAPGIYIPYSYLNQIFWRYDAASGAYRRYQQDDENKVDQFNLATDRLTGEPLTFENVVILFANHRAYTDVLIDIDMLYITKSPALLFRDGKMYEIDWTTRNEEYEKKTGLFRPIRFQDKAGNPFPLKPGQTWVALMPMFTHYEEVLDSTVYFDLSTKLRPGSGLWAVRFYAPKAAK
jgi:hypothetical protein